MRLPHMRLQPDFSVARCIELRIQEPGWGFVEMWLHWVSQDLGARVQESGIGASLVAQWLGICLPMQGTRVWALVREDPTCRTAPKPVHHNYWAHVPQLLKSMCLEPVLCNKRSHFSKKPAYHNEEYLWLATTRESRCAATKTQRSQK